MSLDIARPAAERRVQFTGAPFHHLYVTRGSVAVTVIGLDDQREARHDLGKGDALRVANARRLEVEAAEDTEVLVWRMHAHF